MARFFGEGILGNSRYSIDTTRIIFEQFEDETVLVNAESGFYYSISGTGPEILELIRRGFSLQELSDRLSQQFGVDALEIWSGAKKLVGELVDEGVLVESTGKEANIGPRDVETPIENRTGKYVPPAMTRYSDMREMLLLDPIHQVDERFGWPRK